MIHLPFDHVHEMHAVPHTRPPAPLPNSPHLGFLHGLLASGTDVTQYMAQVRLLGGTWW